MNFDLSQMGILIRIDFLHPEFSIIWLSTDERFWFALVLCLDSEKLTYPDVETFINIEQEVVLLSVCHTYSRRENKNCLQNIPTAFGSWHFDKNTVACRTRINNVCHICCQWIAMYIRSRSKGYRLGRWFMPQWVMHAWCGLNYGTSPLPLPNNWCALGWKKSSSL